MACTVGLRFGEWLKSRRQSAGLSYRALGDACDVAHSFIQYMENGKREPNLDVIRALAPALHVELSEVFAAAFPDLFSNYTEDEKRIMMRWLSGEVGPV